MSFSRSRLVFWLLGVLLFLAPLFRAGKIPSALLLLELLSLAILAILWWNRFDTGKLGRWQVFALSGLLILPLIFLIPFPAFVTEVLPGRADYISALIYAGGDSQGWRALSLYPRETFSGWLVLLLPLSVYLAARSLETKQLRSLLSLVFLITIFQATLGLIQFGAGQDSPFYLGLTYTHFGSAVGTYTSRNNFVGLMYMVLMISLSIFIATLGQHRRKVGNQTFRQRMVYLSTNKGHKAFLFAVFSLLVLLAIVFSRSRAGIGLTMLGVILVSLFFARRIGGRNVYGLTGTIAAVVLGFGISIGLAPVLDRFSANDPLTDGRWTIFEGTFEGIAQFFPLGSGPATFRETFPAFQDLSQANFIINNAHNDYLEWVYDGGLFSALLILVFMLIYIFRWSGVWKKGQWGEFRFIQIGAGIGMLLMLLHEFVDYNLFIPANMVFFAFFTGLFFHDYDEAVDTDSGIKQRKQSDSGTLGPLPSERMRPVGKPEAVPAKNPFLD